MSLEVENSSVYKISKLSFFILFFLCVLMIFSLITIPWYTLRYSPDLMVLSGAIDTVMPVSTIFDSFLDNTLLIYFLYIFFPNTDSDILIIFAQNASILLLGFLLLKYLTPKAVISILLFCYFTVFLNQFRLAIALAFCIVAIKNSDRLSLMYLLILFSFLFHFFVAIWFVSYLFVKAFVISKFKSRIILLFLFVLIGFVLYVYMSVFNDLRYFLYFEEDASPSRTYYFSVLIFLILRTSLDRWSQYFVLITIVLSLSLSFLPSLSGRIGELSIISSILFSNLTVVEYSYSTIRFTNAKSSRMTLVVFICFVFFVYRFWNIIINNSFGL